MWLIVRSWAKVGVLTDVRNNGAHFYDILTHERTRHQEPYTRAGARIVRACRRMLRGRGVSPARVHRLRCAIAASLQRAPSGHHATLMGIRYISGMRLRIHTRMQARTKKIFLLFIIINVCTECAVICALSVHWLCTT